MQWTRRRGRRASFAVALLAWAAVVGSLAWFLAGSQSAGRRSITERTLARVDLGAEFATLYVRDLLSREQAQADSWLQGQQVSPELFGRVSRSLGLTEAVLLNSHGRLLQVLPADPYLLGALLSRRYAHLQAAVAGHAAVSDVVPSAVAAHPIVAFATPYDAPSGRRVFSGGWDVSQTPLGAYLSHMTATPGRRVYLIDHEGEVIASSVGASMYTTLRAIDAPLAAAARRGQAGEFNTHGGERYFVTTAVQGTPWRLLMSVPDAQLFKSIDGPARWLAWVAIGGLAAAGLVLILLLDRLQRSRLQMRRLNTELDRLAHTDALTGVRNRRAIARALQEGLRVAARHDHGLCVLLIDIDYFKRINDTLGHQDGDRVLLHTAQALSAAIRGEDLVGRWGGEEFLVILPFTDETGAVEVAERIRDRVAGADPAIPGHCVTITVGVAEWAGESSDELMSRADVALYAGKAAGRDRVMVAPTPDLAPVL